VKFGVIVDVEASRAIRQAEVGAAKTMIERTEERFGLKPERLVGDTAYGAAPMLNWLVEEKGIAPHIPVFDKSKRNDGTFSRSDFRYDPKNRHETDAPTDTEDVRSWGQTRSDRPTVKPTRMTHCRRQRVRGGPFKIESSVDLPHLNRRHMLLLCNRGA